MSKRRITNETMAQQARERSEFLKLKKAQNGQEAYEKRPSLEEVMPKTFGEKIGNFWYHYKGLVIGVLVMALLFSLAAVQCAKKEKYDIRIIAHAYSYISDDQLKIITEHFEQFCGDIDNDGVGNIQPFNTTFTKDYERPNQGELTMTEMYHTVITGDPQGILFLFDENAYKHMVEINSKKPFFENEIAYLSDEIYEKVKAETGRALPEGLLMTYRKVEGTAIATEEISFKCHDEAKKIIDAYNEKYNQDGEKND